MYHSFLYRLDMYGHHVLKVNIYTGLGKARSPCLGTPPHPLLFGRLMDAHNEKLEIISSLLKESGILPCLLSGFSLTHTYMCAHMHSHRRQMLISLLEWKQTNEQTTYSSSCCCHPLSSRNFTWQTSECFIKMCKTFKKVQMFSAAFGSGGY